MFSRIVTTIALMVLIVYQSIAQVNPTAPSADVKLRKYKNMKDGGLALVVIDGILVVAGGIVEATQMAESMVSMFQPEPESESTTSVGTVLVCSGVVLPAAVFLFWL